MQLLNTREENGALREKEEKTESELNDARDRCGNLLLVQTTRKEETESKCGSVMY